jgi:pilus assembly protein Flp/PilA
MLSSITRFINDESGATAIEYGIIAGLISIAIVGVLSGTEGLSQAEFTGRSRPFP